MKILILTLLLTSCSMLIPSRDYSLKSEKALSQVCASQGKTLDDISEDGNATCIKKDD